MEHDETSNIMPIKYPIITTYTQHAHLIAILSAYEKTKGWIYSNYIQLYYNKDLIDNSWSDFYFPMPYELRPSDCCKWLITQKIDWNTISNKSDSIIDFLIRTIDSKHYAHFMINYYYISQSKYYMNENFTHDILIYGYDKKTKVFHCADFLFDSTKYEFVTISFEDMENAFNHCIIEKYCSYLNGLIYLYEYNENCDYEFDERNILNGIHQYWQSTQPEYWMLHNQKNSDSIVFGMDIYEAITKYIHDCREIVDFQIDIRPFYLLYDHKKIMQVRLNYLKDNAEYYSRKKYSELAIQYEELIKLAKKIFFVVIKYCMIHDETLLDHVGFYFKNIKDLEYKYIQNFFEIENKE